jgi:SAM-dependent methyltransferase
MEVPAMSQPSPLSTPLPWDLVAAEYSVDVAPFFERFADRVLERAAVGAEDHVVDVATGPGTLAFRARERGARVTALDFSDEMIRQLAARVVWRRGSSRAVKRSTSPFIMATVRHCPLRTTTSTQASRCSG